jgi:hypothetical protein
MFFRQLFLFSVFVSFISGMNMLKSKIHRHPHRLIMKVNKSWSDTLFKEIVHSQSWSFLFFLSAIDAYLMIETWFNRREKLLNVFRVKRIEVTYSMWNENSFMHTDYNTCESFNIILVDRLLSVFLKQRIELICKWKALEEREREREKDRM